MQRVLHETCQQYVVRRLSEGWGIVWQKGYHLILSSPDGNILRPVDLRNDVETLRPNAGGTVTELINNSDWSVNPDVNFSCVDEVDADEDTTFVYHFGDQNTSLQDTYNIPNSGVGAGHINSVRVYNRSKVQGSESFTTSKSMVRTEGNYYYGDPEDLTTAYQTFSKIWVTNPAGGDWTWAQINALEIGVRLHRYLEQPVRCTQVYVEVDYTAVEAPTVTTQAVSSIGTTTATGNGNITDNGGENCSKRGVCWNTGGNPTVADDKSEETDSFGTGAFTRPMTGLTPGQHYYVKAYAYNSEGYGYGDQVEFYTNKDATGSDTGSGVDAKASGNPLATFPVRSESGAGAEASAEGAAYSRDETGEGVDALFALLAAMTRAETGAGVEHLLVRAIMAAQTGSGVEHILDRDLVLTESGSGADTLLALLGKLVTESGTGVENSYLHILEGVRDSSDSGSGAEASSLTTLLQRAETGEGAEAVAARALFSREPQMGAIDLARVITAAITGDETGTGAEASLVAYYQKKADSGEGVDSSTLVGLFTGEDSGAGAEAITLLAAMVAQDTGVGVEAVIEFFRKLIDSGHGEENLLLIGYVGRAMKLITYLRAYSDLVVYTKPYSDLRVYTSEVKQ